MIYPKIHNNYTYIINKTTSKSIIIWLLFLITSFILFIIIYVIGSILINKYIMLNASKLLFMLIYLLLLVLWMLQIKKRLDITYGEFIFNEEELSYTTLNKTYYINYKEIDSIKKIIYIENTNIISYKSYEYIIKIKDAGQFIFRYYDNSLDTAINALANKLDIDIIE